jgi:hypothetical protein
MLSPRACLSTSELCSALNQLPDRNPSCLTPLTRLNPRGQLGTQQASVGGFVSQATHGCKLLVDGVGGQMPRFQVQAIDSNRET